VMIYGDGGAGKTTLAIDLSCDLAAGDDWLGMRVESRARVLLIENEGPRPHFRAKLRRKLDAWGGGAIDDRIQVLEEPWSMLTLAQEGWRVTLAAAIVDRNIGVVVLGPVTRAGMDEAGTLQETATSPPCSATCAAAPAGPSRSCSSTTRTRTARSRAPGKEPSTRSST
jgi:hypothetical protein